MPANHGCSRPGLCPGGKRRDFDTMVLGKGCFWFTSPRQLSQTLGVTELLEVINMKVSTISMGYGGVLVLESPVLTLGKGKPSLAITCSVHGDEHIGSFIVAKLIEKLPEKNMTGSVSFVLAANPSAQFLNQRVSPQDLKDLNRMGKGRLNGTYTERIAANLFKFLRTFDFVVNIHEFEMHTPVTAVYMNVGNNEVREKTLSGIRAFMPDIVWVIEYSLDSDIQYSATLDTALAKVGVPNFPIETTSSALISDAEIESATSGLIGLMKHIGVVTDRHDEQSRFHDYNFYIRKEFTSDVSGIWEPHLQIPQKISKDAVVGHIYRFPTLHKMEIKSPTEGMLLQIRHRQLVHTGTSLFSVGVTYEMKE